MAEPRIPFFLDSADEYVYNIIESGLLFFLREYQSAFGILTAVAAAPQKR